MWFRAKLRIKDMSNQSIILDQTEFHNYELPEISIYRPEDYLPTFYGSPTGVFRSTDTTEPASVVYQLLKIATDSYTGPHSKNIGLQIHQYLKILDTSTGYTSKQYWLSPTNNTAQFPCFFFGSNNYLVYKRSGTGAVERTFNNPFFIMGGTDLRDFGYFYTFILPNRDPNANYHWVVWRYLSNNVDCFYTYCLYQANNSTISPAALEDFNAVFEENMFPDDDPYNGVIPPTGAEGGPTTGSGIEPSEPVPEPDPLIVSSADTGFTRIYNPSLSQLQDFAHYMWTDTNIFQTVWNHVKQYFEDPMDAFIALNLLPVSVPSSGSEEVRLLFINTGKYMNVASNQFVTVELGELTLKEAYGSALDYAPNTQIDLFLPYIGTVSVDADEVMGRRVKLTYKVDICTGVCVAIVKVELDIDGGKAFFPLYQFTGNCAIRIPFTAANMDGYINAALNAAKIATVAAGTGLASAASAAAPTAMTTTAAANAATGSSTALSTEVASHAPVTPGTIAAGFPALRLGDAVRNASQNASLFNAAATGMKQVPSAIGIRAAMKPRFEKSSGFVGNSGYMSYKVPFFIMKVPRMVNPAEYGKYNGYPSLSYQSFSALNGYAEIQQVQLTNINATANELDEIQSMLKSGVIF